MAIHSQQSLSKRELELSTMAEHIRDIEQKLHHIHYDVLEARDVKEGA